MSGSVSMVDGHIDPDKKPMTFEDVKRIRENPTTEDVDNKELHRLIDIAIEKQILKKPVNKTKSDNSTAKHYKNCSIVVCPLCNGRLKLKSKGKHCDKCGQALDWSDTE